MKENMFYGAGPLIFKMAEELRNTMTAAEQIIWKHIHINEWKLKFRRQHPISNYIADFYCHALKLVIEIDGDIHDSEEAKANDGQREQTLKNLGLTILRFKNEQVFKETKAVIKKIHETVRVLQNSPLGDEGFNSSLGDGSRGILHVIKIGGNIIDDELQLKNFLKQFAAIQSPLQGTRAKKILIHGGGKLATKLAGDLNIPQQVIEGRRVTNADTLKVVTMVYAGYINKNIVAQLQANGCNAIGLSGVDGNIITAHKRPSDICPSGDGIRNIDYGYAGDIDSINTDLLQLLLEQNMAIVLAPITHNNEGQLLNTNADTIAQEIAKAFCKVYDAHLIYTFEKAGVLSNVEDETSVLKELTYKEYKELQGKQKIFAGMIPKLDNAFAALQTGVKKVIIGKAENLSDLINGNSGTTIIYE